MKISGTFTRVTRITVVDGRRLLHLKVSVEVFFTSSIFHSQCAGGAPPPQRTIRSMFSNPLLYASYVALPNYVEVSDMLLFFAFILFHLLYCALESC